MKKKIAFIVQRYGLEVNGGAEYHCRLIVEKLKDQFDIEVLTSCAKDYLSWADEYPEGEDWVNGIKVSRFATGTVRNWHKFRSICRKLEKRKSYHKILRLLRLLEFHERNRAKEKLNSDYEKWVRLQGPYLPNLIDYLRENQQNYDALIFFTYLYYPTIEGLKINPEKSILIPTAHDEPPIYFPFFRKLFNSPKVILYNTLSEKRFVNHLYENSAICSAVAGIGIDAPEPSIIKPVKEILNIDAIYFIYIGRVDIAKGCKTMFEYFLAYIKNTGRNVNLVLAGQVFMEIPASEHIISLGFVDEDVKINLLKSAKALIIPSLYESLSLVTLESMAYGVPVIGNEQCEVIKDHIENSKSGFIFKDYITFENALNNAINSNLETMKNNARKYISENYTWPVTIEKYKKAIEYVSHH